MGIYPIKKCYPDKLIHKPPVNMTNGPNETLVKTTLNNGTHFRLYFFAQLDSVSGL